MRLFFILLPLPLTVLAADRMREELPLKSEKDRRARLSPSKSQPLISEADGEVPRDLSPRRWGMDSPGREDIPRESRSLRGRKYSHPRTRSADGETGGGWPQ